MQLTDLVGVQPWTFASFADELDEAPHAPAAHDLGETLGVLREDVDEMAQAHQEVIALHGGPVF